MIHDVSRRRNGRSNPTVARMPPLPTVADRARLSQRGNCSTAWDTMIAGTSAEVSRAAPAMIDHTAMVAMPGCAIHRSISHGGSCRDW